MAGGKFISNFNSRMDYDIAVKSLTSQGIIVEPGKLTQSYLRSEAILKQNESYYEFPILVNTTNPGTTTSPTAKLLNQQDVFFVNDLQYWIEVHTIPGDNPDLLRYVPNTYPGELMNRTGAVFSKLGYKLWSGEMKIIVNGDVILPAWDLKRHLNVPETQVQAVSGPFPNSLFYNDHDQFDGMVSASCPQEPNIVFIGNKGITISVKFPENINNAIGGAGFQIMMVLQWKGLLAQNVSKTA